MTARVRVTEVSGVCVLGQRLRAAQVFSWREGRMEPDLCPLPCARLKSWVDQPQPGQDAGPLRLVCRDADHRVVFMLEWARRSGRREPKTVSR